MPYKIAILQVHTDRQCILRYTTTANIMI